MNNPDRNPTKRNDSSSSEGSAEEDGGPFHVLMAMSTPTFVPDPRMKRDYVSKRAKAYGINTNTASASISSNDNNSKSNGPLATTITSPWDGVSRVERELVDCCERIIEDNDHHHHHVDSSDSSNNNFGALQIDKEVQFLGILARDCHSMATKCLALGILEKTLEAYLDDTAEEEGDDEAEEGEAADNSDDEYNKSSDQGAGQKQNADRAERARKRRRVMNSNGRSSSSISNDENEQTEGKDIFLEKEEVTRLEQFLAAGGLRILNRWLVEACTDDPLISNLKPPPPCSGSRSTPTTNSNRTPPATTRPLIIPILRFLEKIPFDRKVVVASKINKQIRKVGKLVDGILESRARGKHRQEDLENWTTETFSSPFLTIKNTIRERLDIVLKHEAGVLEDDEIPDWIHRIEHPKNGSNNKTKREDEDKVRSAVDADAAAAAKKAKTQDLAAKERKAEREGLRSRLHEAENEHQERLAKLRQQLRKLKQEHAPSLVKPSTNHGRKVLWKDGMRSQMNRNRDLLEEVRVFVKNTPAATTEGEGDVTPTGRRVKKRASEEENSVNPGPDDVEPAENDVGDDDDEDLFS